MRLSCKKVIGSTDSAEQLAAAFLLCSADPDGLDQED